MAGVGRVFRKGQSGNPAGTKPGMRQRFSKAVIDAFAKDFQHHGGSVIEEVREKDPATYLRIAASLVPKEIEGNFAGNITINIVE